MPLPVNMSVLDPHYNPATGADDPNYNGPGGSINYGPKPGIATSITPNAAAAPAPDPYAQWGGKASYDKLISGFNTQKSNIYSTSNEAAQTQASGLHSSILDYLDSLRSGQSKINEAGTQNELAKKQGYNSVMDLVSHGLQSGGVMLANKNASSSSATEALARAYGDIGRRQANQVNNQYEQGQHQIGLQQQDLELQRSQGLRHLDESKQQAVSNIVLDARNKLAQLDAYAVDKSLPTRIAIDQEKAKIQQQVSGVLGQYDIELQQGAAGIQPNSPEDRRAAAFGMANAGVSATNPFDFTTVGPAQYQDTGPFASALPLFSQPRKKTAWGVLDGPVA